MAKIFLRAFFCLLAVLAIRAIVACEEKGPAEKLGEKIDATVDEAKEEAKEEYHHTKEAVKDAVGR